LSELAPKRKKRRRSKGAANIQEEAVLHVPEEAVTLAPSADDHDVSFNVNPVQHMPEEDATPSTSGTPSSSASQVVDPSSSSAPASTPLTSAQPKAAVITPVSCKGCQHKAKVANLQRANKRPKGKVATLKKTIAELQSVSATA